MQSEYFKLLSAFAMLSLTFLFTMLPLLLFKRNTQNEPSVPNRSLKLRVMSLLNCFGGGVFLATCLMHLLPDVQEQMDIVVKSLKIDLNYPVSEFLFGFGFLAILTVEQIILNCEEEDSHEAAPLIQPDLNINNPNNDDHIVVHANYGAIADPEPIIHANHGHQSILRSFLLVLALSLHSVFEGLAIGLQESNGNVLRILLAVLFHKSIIAFTLGLNLTHSDLRSANVIKTNLFFAFSSPIGIVVGLLVVDFAKGLTLAVTSGVLQGMAAGTFLYITLFEVLPHELNDFHDRLGKVLCVVLGYAAVSTMLMFLPE